MLRLSCSQPLLPKPFAEMAMQLYLEDHFPQLQSYGVTSREPGGGILRRRALF